jgi:hypothetical protein
MRPLDLSAQVGASEAELLAPSTIGPELCNALFQQHRRGHLSLDEVREFFSSFAEAYARVSASSGQRPPLYQ